MTDEEIEAMFTPGPPSAALLGWKLLDHDEARGWVKVGFVGSPQFLNPAGRVGPAVLVKSGGALYPSSIDMNISYLAAAKPGPLVCEGEVLRLGKTVGFVEGGLMDEDGRVLARATLLVPAERVAT